jgi:hypothetical protein
MSKQHKGHFSALKPGESYLDYRRRVLDPLSSTFCGAKWYNATIWLGSGKSTSCHHPPAHQVDLEGTKTNFKLIHNTPEKKEDRRLMQIGQRPPGCEYCWKIEDIGGDQVSDRPYKSSAFSDESLIEAAKTPHDQDVDLQTLEIAFDRTCQFACSYCNPGFSTTWVKDIKKNGPYQGLTTDGRNHFTHTHEYSQLYEFGETNPYIEAFFKWWDESLHRTLKELRITGGEPLMSGYTWKLFDWFRSNPTSNSMQLTVNSNLGFDKSVLERMLDSTDGLELMLYTSNESTGAKAEYIRDGLDWLQWQNNLEFLISTGKLRLSVMMTINAISLDGLVDILALIMKWKKQYGEWRINFSLNILRFPSFQGVLVLPHSLRNHYKEILESWYKQYQNDTDLNMFERKNLERLIDYLDQVDVPHGEGFDRISAEKDFKKFYQQYDQRRNKNFIKTFSQELVDWYESI